MIRKSKKKSLSAPRERLITCRASVWMLVSYGIGKPTKHAVAMMGSRLQTKRQKGLFLIEFSAFSEIDASRDLFVVDPLNLFTQKATTGRSKS